MYKNNNGYREWHINYNLFIKEFINKCKIFNLNPRNIKFYSQQNEDKYIIQYLLKEKMADGTFLEIGACDGVLYSNTKTLEDYFNFNGILFSSLLIQSVILSLLLKTLPETTKGRNFNAITFPNLVLIFSFPRYLNLNS